MLKHNSNFYTASQYFLASLIVFFVFSFVLAPIAEAHIGPPTGPLVPCGLKNGPSGTTVPCEVCHLYTLAHNIMDFALWVLAVPLLVVALLVAGIYWLTSAGSEERVKKGKSILFSAVIGFLIAFGAWLIVNTIMDTLGGSPFRGTAWNDTNFCADSPIRSDAGGGIITPQPGTMPPPPPPPPPPDSSVGTPLSHSAAIQALQTARISVASSGNCSDRNNPNCTSLEGIGQNTINRIITFKNDCGSACQVVITGGTEAGHSTSGSTCLHSNGCKVDIQPSSQVTAYIKSQYQSIGTRSDGAALYRAPNGTVFALESGAPAHWDIGLRI